MENRLRKIRKDKGLTMKEVGVLANTTEVQIYRLEKEKVGLDIYWMGRLSKALGCKPYELLPEEWQPAEIFSNINYQFIVDIIDILTYYLKQEKLTIEENDRIKLIQYLYENNVVKDNIIPMIKIWQVANPSMFRKTG